MWSMHTIETELAEGNHDIVVPLRNGETKAVVTVEHLGEKPAFDARVSNIADPAQLSRYARVRVFVGKIAQGARDITVHISQGIRSFVRITVTTFRDELKRAAGKLPCNSCKRLVSFILTTTLSIVGVPFMDVPVSFDNALLERLREIMNDKSYAMLAELLQDFGIGPWEGILKVLAGIEFVFEFADRAYERVCQFLGPCPTPQKPA